LLRKRTRKIIALGVIGLEVYRTSTWTGIGIGMSMGSGLRGVVGNLRSTVWVGITYSNSARRIGSMDLGRVLMGA
jgi:hypothetical protein